MSSAFEIRTVPGRFPEVELPTFREDLENDRKLHRENPTIAAERIIFLAETAAIHRKFIREIMGDGKLEPARKAELVIFTGSTDDVVAEPLSIAAKIEGFPAGELPDLISWKSSEYWPISRGGPNTLVYKGVSRDDVELALANVQAAVLICRNSGDDILVDESQVASQLARIFPNELVLLESSLSSILTGINTGQYVAHAKSYEVPRGKPRVDLMKALYPKFVGSLFHDDGSPKEVAFYDNVSITGEKINAYLEFFEALGIADKSRVFIMYTKPGASQSFTRTATQVTVGKEITENFVVRITDTPEDASLFGLKHDQETSLRLPDISRIDPKRIRPLTHLAYHEQLQLPEAVAQLRSVGDALKMKLLAAPDEMTQMTFGYLNEGSPLARALSPAYTDYDPDRYDEFEKMCYLAPDDKEKRYFREIRVFLDWLASRVTSEKIHLIVLDSDLLLILQGFFQLDQFHSLRDQVILTNFDDVSEKIKAHELPTGLNTIALGNSFPRLESGFQQHSDKFRTLGIDITQLHLLSDNRSKWASKERLVAGREVTSKMKRLVTECGMLWHQIEATMGEENIAATLASKCQNNWRRMRLPSADEMSLFSDGERMNHALSELRKQNSQGIPSADILGSKEYTEFQQMVQSVIADGIKLCDEVLSKLEEVSKKFTPPSLEVWDDSVSEFEGLLQKLEPMGKATSLFYGLRLVSDSVLEGESEGEKNIFELFYAFYLKVHEILKKHTSTLAGILRDEFKEKYYLGSEKIPVSLRSTSPSEYYFFPKISQNPNEASIINYFRSVEKLRYLIDVVAHQATD